MGVGSDAGRAKVDRVARRRSPIECSAGHANDHGEPKDEDARNRRERPDEPVLHPRSRTDESQHGSERRA